jgi:hypothetical protein
MKHICPICGYAKLTEAPRGQSGGGSYEICPSCGFQFGVSDDDSGYTYATWRTEWKKNGMEWASVSGAPKSWNAAKQLKNLALKSPPKNL